MAATAATSPAAHHRPWYTVLYVQVLIAIAIGIAVGYYYPDLGKELKPLGDGFIALIKMMIAPVIFCTVVHGIASMGDLKKVGRVGVKTLFYFEVVSTLALGIGLLVGEIVQPGVGFNIDPATLDAKAVATYVTRAKEEGIVAHLLAIIPPDTFFGALARGRPAAGPAGIDPDRLCAYAPRRGRRAHHPRDRQCREGVLHGHRHDRARRADRCVRRDGLHDRRVRRRLAVETDRADRRVLRDQRHLRAAGARHHRVFRRLLDPALHRLHQGRAADRRRHLVVGDRAAADDPEDAAARRLEIGCRPGDPDRLQLQSRRHQHLHDAGDAVPGAGDQHAADHRAGARHPGHRHDHLEGRLGRHRRGFRHARRHARDRARHPDPVARESSSASTSS